MANQMRMQFVTATTLALLLLTVATSASQCQADEDAITLWQQMQPQVWRTSQMPYTYALQSAEDCLLIGAAIPAEPAEQRLPPGSQRCSLVLLTHHHRDSCSALPILLKAGSIVRAPKLSEAYLSPAGVKKYWDVSLPAATPGEFPPLFHRFWSDWSYLVHPTGLDGIAYDFADGDTITFAPWKVKVIATPGHSKDHTAFAVTHEKHDHILAFCGDAISSQGKMWSPYTLEWHHQQDTGFREAAASLRKLGQERPTVLYPEHGAPIDKHITLALQVTSLHLELVALLKNFDAYSKSLKGDPPTYQLLAAEQVGTANPQGNTVFWTQLSEHLFLTGNTYALVSKEGPVLLVDPYARNLVPRMAELQLNFKAGAVEVALISHAHNDHYTGIFALADRKSFQVWTLDLIADVVDHPQKYRAPYVDPRVPNVDRSLKAGEVVKWREYKLTIHHQPGQTRYAMGVEVEIDGKRCLFSGDNFYHIDQYTGSGGWSGRNTGLPAGYAATAEQILALKPDWILAEHGGAFVYNAQDFENRRNWALHAAKAADGLSPHDDHRFDWDPQRMRIEPVVCRSPAGRQVDCWLELTNPLLEKQSYTIRQSLADPANNPPAVMDNLQVSVPAGGTVRRPIMLKIAAQAPPGRYILPLESRNQVGEPDPSDLFMVLEVIPE